MENRELILETALDLFYTRGYDAVGVQEIAEKSGVTKPTLYYYFKSKYGLLEALIKSRGAGFFQDLHQACTYAGDLHATLCDTAKVFSDFAGRDPRFYGLFFALFHTARENEAYRAVRPLVQRLAGEVEHIFDAAAGQLGNMQGRQRQFSMGFLGLVIYYIELKFQDSEEFFVKLSGEEICSLVHQFMHGIYS